MSEAKRRDRVRGYRGLAWGGIAFTFGATAALLLAIPIALVSSRGPGPLELEVLLGLGLLWSLCLLLAGTVAVVLGSKRVGVICISVAMGFLVAGSMTVRWGRNLRSATFADLAVRSQPLIDALLAYEEDHKKPAGDLADLIPEYLPEIPGTGLAAYPSYGYEMYHRHSGRTFLWYDLGAREGPMAESPRLYDIGAPDHAILVFELLDARLVRGRVDRMPQTLSELPFDRDAWLAGEGRMEMARNAIRHAHSEDKVVELLGEPEGKVPDKDSGWELFVECSNGLGNWDRFFYWSGSEYPEHCRGRIERIGDWAYAHE